MLDGGCSSVGVHLAWLHSLSNPFSSPPMEVGVDSFEEMVLVCEGLVSLMWTLCSHTTYSLVRVSFSPHAHSLPDLFSSPPMEVGVDSLEEETVLVREVLVSLMWTLCSHTTYSLVRVSFAPCAHSLVSLFEKVCFPMEVERLQGFWVESGSTGQLVCLPSWPIEVALSPIKVERW
ncbi:hypothetical protein SUGI_0420320 [Cryptomeria japonica]|nr:hypothetical protein SUGI_0420320 [Cryptomeria japonica]